MWDEVRSPRRNVRNLYVVVLRIVGLSVSRVISKVVHLNRGATQRSSPSPLQCLPIAKGGKLPFFVICNEERVPEQKWQGRRAVRLASLPASDPRRIGSVVGSSTRVGISRISLTVFRAILRMHTCTNGVHC